MAATALPEANSVFDRIESISPTQPGQTADEQAAFDDWFLDENLEKLKDPHCNGESLWDIVHWVFSVPFVSDEYADRGIRNITDPVVARYRQSVKLGATRLNVDTTFSLKHGRGSLSDIAFEVNEAFKVVPHRTSFEAVCMRLGYDPQEARNLVHEYMVAHRLYDRLEHDAPTVKAKIKPAAFKQGIMFPQPHRRVDFFVRTAPAPTATTELVSDEDNIFSGATADLFQ